MPSVPGSDATSFDHNFFARSSEMKEMPVDTYLLGWRWKIVMDIAQNIQSVNEALSVAATLLLSL